MTLEDFRALCLSPPGASEEVKWEDKLCFQLGKKMFAIALLDVMPQAITVKASAEDFARLIGRPGFVPAPYLARYKWVSRQDIDGINPQEISRLVQTSYDLVVKKLPAKTKTSLGLG